MSGPAVHYLTAQDVPQYLSRMPDCDPSGHLADVLRQNPTYVAAGSLGPDFLFFNVSDWPMVPDHLAPAIVEVSETLNQFYTDVMETFPVLEQIHETKKDFDNLVQAGINASNTLSDIQAMVQHVEDTVTLLLETINTGLKSYVLNVVDIYGLFAHPIQNCEDDEDWWWFDILHYRRSGDFASQLLSGAEGDDELVAYALGYLSHIATDTVGHAYVNSIVRGPYRTHAQRHKVVEQFQDVWAYKQITGDEFITSKLYREYRFRGGINALPRKVTELFSDAASRTYGDSFEFSELSSDEVDAAYRLWYQWFRNTTSASLLPRKLPNYTPLDQSIQQSWEEFKTNVSTRFPDLDDVFSPPSLSGSSLNPSALLNAIKSLFEDIVNALGAVLLVLDMILSVITSIARNVLYFFLSKVYEALYTAYDRFVYLVSLSGFAFPHTRHLTHAPVKHMTDPTIADANGNVLSQSWSYPVQAVDRSFLSLLPQEAHLVYPDTQVEQEETVEGPTDYLSESPRIYIDSNLHLSENTVEDLGSHSVRELNDIMRSPVLGNGSRLTARLYCNFTQSGRVPNLNLDADRGMAHPTWLAEEECVNGELSSPVTPEFEE